MDSNSDGIVLDPPQPWWHAYPAPKSSPEVITAEELAAHLRDPSQRTLVAVIDVRRADYAGGHVRGCLQCPAQTFYDGLRPFAEKFAGIEKVVFYCGRSNGRGPRCAGWYQDYLNELNGSSASKAYVLQGGIVAWLSKFGKDEDLVEYE